MTEIRRKNEFPLFYKFLGLSQLNKLRGLAPFRFNVVGLFEFCVKNWTEFNLSLDVCQIFFTFIGYLRKVQKLMILDPIISKHKFAESVKLKHNLATSSFGEL